MRSPLLVLVIIIGALSILATTRDARADDPIAAEAAFSEARALMDQGRYAEACPKLEASYRLDPALGTLMNLAECLRQTGRTASAWLRYREASAIALQHGQPEREEIARDRAKALEARLCRVTVRRAEGPLPPGLVARRDGTPIDPGLYDTAVPVDPGAHELVFEAPGRSPARVHVEIREPQEGVPCADTTVEIPSLIPLPPPPPEPPASPPHRWRTQHTLAVAAVGAGALSLAAAGVFAVRATSLKEGDAGCTAQGCNAAGLSVWHQAGSAADAATVLLSVGAALVVGGAVVWILSPSLRERAPRTLAITF